MCLAFQEKAIYRNCQVVLTATASDSYKFLKSRCVWQQGCLRFFCFGIKYKECTFIHANGVIYIAINIKALTANLKKPSNELLNSF